MKILCASVAMAALAGGSALVTVSADHHGDKMEEGFVALFDGTSLDGWTSSLDNPAAFSIEDGVLVVKGDRAHLFYSGEVADHDFTDFELRLKVRTTEGSNSGVYFHTVYQEEGWPEIGHEAQVNSTQVDPRKTGSLYSVADIYVSGDEHEPALRVEGGNSFAARDKAPSTDGEWFDYTIRVEGKTVTIKVDGETTVKWTEPEDWDREGRKIASGTFALQAHDPDSEVHYKDIRVKVLTPEMGDE